MNSKTANGTPEPETREVFDDPILMGTVLFLLLLQLMNQMMNNKCTC